MMKQRALFIGGTGTISTAITAALAAEGKWDLTLLNRSNRPEAVPDGVRVIRADIRDEAQVAELLEGTSWDCVCDFIGFVPAEVERDWRISGGRPGVYLLQHLVPPAFWKLFRLIAVHDKPELHGE